MVQEKWMRIENRERFLKCFRVDHHYHPDDPRHTPYWRELKRRCIEGVWFQDFKKWRFGPGRLGFYGTFCTITETDEEEKVRHSFIPLIRDIEWERAYMFLEAEGFSGWSDDDEYTSDLWWFDVRKNGLPKLTRLNAKKRKRLNAMLNKNGALKKFKPARENIRQLHDEPKGKALYWNEAKNIIEFGSRGGGKSFFYALAGALYEVIFNGVKYYTDKNRLKPPKVEVLIGSGNADKSSEFCDKIEEAMNELAKNPKFGVWGEPGDEDYSPSPFFKQMRGDLKVNNKARKNPWQHIYEKKVNGTWIDGFGDKSLIYHVNYSTNKKGGAQSGAGGRYTKVFYEECGLTELLIEALASNTATTNTGTKFGVQIFLGTSGNMETVLPAKKIFTHPKDYGCLEFPDYWENSTTPIGFFLPCYITNNDFKDEHGNTDLDAAKAYYAAEEEKAAQSDDPLILQTHRMNYPRVPSDMWQTGQGSILPAQEAELREKQLMKNNLYQKLGTPIKLIWDSSEQSGVTYEVHHGATPYYEFPLESDQMRKDLSGAIMIYEWPVYLQGEIPPDLYIFTHDPYVSDEWDKGGSLGVVHVWMNPKYLHLGIKGNVLAATYIGKARGGKKEYYENLEKLLAFYGNSIRGLWYEANRGEYCRGHFLRKKKAKLLCLRPNLEKGSNAFQQKITQYGYIAGSNTASIITMLDDFADWLLAETTIGDETKRNIERIPCIFTIRQIKMHNIKGNFDAVDSARALPLFLREQEHRMLNEKRDEYGRRENPLAFLSTNKKIFRNNEHIPRRSAGWDTNRTFN